MTVKYQANFIFDNEKDYERYKALVDENLRLIYQMIECKKICTWKGGLDALLIGDGK